MSAGVRSSHPESLPVVGLAAAWLVGLRVRLPRGRLDAGEDRRTLVPRREPHSSWGQRTGVTSGVSVVAVFVRAGRPALPRCSDFAVRRQDDRWGVGSPRSGACGRSVCGGRRGRIDLGGRTCAGAGRKHLRDDEQARTAIGWSGGSAYRLLDVRVEVDGRERFLAELARRMWKARRQSLRAIESEALLWLVRSRTCRKYSWSGEVWRVACWPASYSAQRSTGEPSWERWPAARLLSDW